MKNWHVKIELDGKIKNQTYGCKQGGGDIFMSHNGPITLVIRSAIEKMSQDLGCDLTKYVKKIEAKEVR